MDLSYLSNHPFHISEPSGYRPALDHFSDYHHHHHYRRKDVITQSLKNRFHFHLQHCAPSSCWTQPVSHQCHEGLPWVLSAQLWIIWPKEIRLSYFYLHHIQNLKVSHSLILYHSLQLVKFFCLLILLLTAVSGPSSALKEFWQA